MNNKEEKIKKYLQTLGLSEEEALIYLSLVKHGESTTLELSRNIKISRTQTYRFLGQMKDKGVVEEIIDKHTTRARAVDSDRLYYLVEEQVNKSKKLHKEFSEIKALLSGFIGANQQGTKVLFYRGQEGLRQLAWNALRAKGGLRGYSYRLWESAIGEKFAGKWFKEAIRRSFQMRELYSDNYLKSIKGVKPMATWPEFKGLQCQSRYVSPDILTINHQIDIYNDVVAYYNWYKDEVFGIEIYNSKISRMQKQIFDFLWKKATLPKPF